MLGARIRRARQALGLSLRQLAEDLGLSHAAIKKYEDNQVVPASDTLLKLAERLHVKVEYFFRPERFTLKSIQYRNADGLPAKQLKEITAYIVDQAERRFDLESLFPQPSTPVFSLEGFPRKISKMQDLETLAERLREFWRLGLGPIPNLIDVFEEQSIKVFEVDNQKYPKFEGLSANINGAPVIVIGNQWPGIRQRFTLAHELGHLVLSQRLTSALDEEAACHRFAGAFLLPQKTLMAILGEHRHALEVRELDLVRQEFGISMLSILHRLEDLGIISSVLYRQLRSEFQERGWTQREPGFYYPQEKARIFEQMVFRALAESYVGEAKAAELMGMSLDSFRSLRSMEA